MTSARPLEGVTVISLEHAMAAPFCTRQLADLGARVIKIERPLVGDFSRSYDERVDGLSAHFVWANRSKESLTLNLKSDEGQVILQKLLSQADIVVQNLAPGAAARLGVSASALHPLYPRLIVCDISGYGEGGPYQDKKAYDLMIQSEAAFLSVTGTPDNPSKAGNPIADTAAGMYAYSSILVALLKRGQTGKGCRIEVSMLEALTEWMGYPLYYAYNNQLPPARSGASHATIYPYGSFEAGDGKSFMLGLQNEREWKLFCEQVMESPALADDPRFASNSLRHASRAELRQLIMEKFSQLTAAQVIGRLEKARIANANVNSVHDLWLHPQLAARERWVEIDSPAGPLPALLPPGKNDSFEYRMGAVPALGEHTDEILSGLGYDRAQIQALRNNGVV